MLFSNEYFGYQSRNHNNNKSRRKLKRNKFSSDQKLHSPDIFQNGVMKKNKPTTLNQKPFDRLSKFIYKSMSPVNVAKKMNYKVNLFKQMTTRKYKYAENNAEEKSFKKQKDIKFPHFKTLPKRKELNERFYSEDYRLKRGNDEIYLKDPHFKQTTIKKHKKRTGEMKTQKKLKHHEVLRESTEKVNFLKENNAKSSKKVHRKGQQQNQMNSLSEIFSTIFASQKQIQVKNNQKAIIMGQQQDSYQIMNPLHHIINQQKIKTFSFYFQNSKASQQGIEKITDEEYIQSSKKQGQIKVQNKMKTQYGVSHTKQKKSDEMFEISRKISRHYQKIKIIYQYGEHLKEANPIRIQVFERQIYLCYRMYYEELKSMTDVLSGKYGSSNCFKLSGCSLKIQEINDYRQKNTAEIHARVKKIQSQIDCMRKILVQLSTSLLSKVSNDPYLKLDKNNFEPELINELFEETVQLTEKIQTLKMKEEQKNNNDLKISQLTEKRHRSILMILLVGQLRGFSNLESYKIDEDKLQYKTIQEYYLKFYSVYRKYVEEVVEKFQEMPL